MTNSVKRSSASNGIGTGSSQFRIYDNPSGVDHRIFITREDMAWTPWIMPLTMALNLMNGWTSGTIETEARISAESQ